MGQRSGFEGFLRTAPHRTAPRRGQWQPLPGLVGTDGSTMKSTIYWAWFSHPSLLEQEA